MTITFVAAGAAVTGNNASLAPAAPAGVAAGDLVVIVASIRNSGTGVVATPTGWTNTAFGNVSFLSRVWTFGDTMPTITFTGGVANADTIARAVAFRGVAADAATPAASAGVLNSSAANITTSPLVVPNDRHAVLEVAWKQDDATAYTTPAGFTAVGLTSTTTGDDASQALYYLVQTAAATIGLTSITVTGGAAAISRSALIAFKPAAAIAAVEQDFFPPRVLVSVTDLTLGDDVRLYRLVDGDLTLLRGGTADNVIDSSLLVVDSELPFGTPVAYVAVVNDTVTYQTSATTYALGGDKVVFTDAVTGAAAEAVILAWPEKQYARPGSVHQVGARNIVVSGEVPGWTGDVQLVFDAYSSGQNWFTLMRTATQGVMQMRRPDPAYDGLDAYVTVLNARETRFSQDGTDERRIWIASMIETDSWSLDLAAVGTTYGDVESFYTGQTYADAAGDFSTYLAAEQADYTP